MIEAWKQNHISASSPKLHNYFSSDRREHENTDSIFLDFAAYVTQKVYMLLNRRGIPTMLKRTQNHKEAFHIATRVEL